LEDGLDSDEGSDDDVESLLPPQRKISKENKEHAGSKTHSQYLQTASLPMAPAPIVRTSSVISEDPRRSLLQVIGELNGLTLDEEEVGGENGETTQGTEKQTVDGDAVSAQGGVDVGSLLDAAEFLLTAARNARLQGVKVKEGIITEAKIVSDQASKVVMGLKERFKGHEEGLALLEAVGNGFKALQADIQAKKEEQDLDNKREAEAVALAEKEDSGMTPRWRRNWWRMQALVKIRVIIKVKQARLHKAKNDGFWGEIESRIEGKLRNERGITEGKISTAKAEAIEEAIDGAMEAVKGEVDSIRGRMTSLEDGRKALDQKMDKSQRASDRAGDQADKALKVAQRALKGGGGGGGAPIGTSSAPEVELALESMIVHQGPIVTGIGGVTPPATGIAGMSHLGPTTEQIMEHVRVRVVDLVNEHIGDKFATDHRLERAMRAVEVMPEVQDELQEVRRFCQEALVATRDLETRKVDRSILQSHQAAFAAGQEQLSQHLTDEINSVLSKMEASAGGFKAMTIISTLTHLQPYLNHPCSKLNLECMSSMRA